ncbi:stabilin-2-like [Danio aesculapii]|uniref:stabilin-2-like n=1 Tax=Danio aesculapii TaxID=1142201 RepID=UPI0024C04EB9|nr:stabilin-2-like [Danio aesculapii]
MVNCLSGWSKDGDECQAINNCLDPSRGGCHPNATCIYVGPGQTDCACKSGYHGNRRECEPVNQCVEQKGGCHFLEVSTIPDLLGFNQWISMSRKRRCMYSRVLHGDTLLTIGCKFSCEKIAISASVSTDAAKMV